MEKESTFLRMVRFTKVTFRITKLVDMERSLTQDNMRVISTKGNF